MNKDIEDFYSKLGPLHEGLRGVFYIKKNRFVTYNALFIENKLVASNKEGDWKYKINDKWYFESEALKLVKLKAFL